MKKCSGNTRRTNCWVQTGYDTNKQRLTHQRVGVEQIHSTRLTVLDQCSLLLSVKFIGCGLFTTFSWNPELILKAQRWPYIYYENKNAQ